MCVHMQQLSAHQLVPAVIVPQPGGLPALRQLSIHWPGTVAWTTASRPWEELLPALSKLDFVVGTQLCLENRGLSVLPSLRQLSLADGTLELSACFTSEWLPPSVTSLWLPNAGIRGIPATVSLLTSLRRQATALCRALGRRLSCCCPAGPIATLQLFT